MPREYMKFGHRDKENEFLIFSILIILTRKLNSYIWLVAKIVDSTVLESLIFMLFKTNGNTSF